MNIIMPTDRGVLSKCVLFEVRIKAAALHINHSPETAATFKKLVILVLICTVLFLHEFVFDGHCFVRKPKPWTWHAAKWNLFFRWMKNAIGAITIKVVLFLMGWRTMGWVSSYLPFAAWLSLFSSRRRSCLQPRCPALASFFFLTEQQKAKSYI